MIIQGDVFEITCPYCRGPALAVRIAPTDSVVRCLSCHRWVPAEDDKQ